jgi:hypothetical protein
VRGAVPGVQHVRHGRRGRARLCLGHTPPQV